MIRRGAAFSEYWARRWAGLWLAAHATLLSGCSQDLSSFREGYGLRPVEIELAEENEAQLLHSGVEGVPVPARLSIERDRLRGMVALSGQASLTYFKRGYKFDVEGDRGALGYKSVRISQQQQDDTFLRTLVGYRVFKKLGLPTPKVEPIALYLQGQYQGLYLLIERIDSRFFSKRDLEAERVYEGGYATSDFGPRLIADPEYGFSARIGELHPLDIVRLSEWATGTADSANYQQGAQLWDYDNLVLFMAGQLFLRNCDSFFNNLVIWKPEGDSRFQAVPWDWENTFNALCDHSFIRQRTYLAQKLIEHSELRTRIQAKITELRAEFDTAELQSIVDEEKARIAGAYRADRYLGGLGKDLDERAQKLMSDYADSMSALTDL